MNEIFDKQLLVIFYDIVTIISNDGTSYESIRINLKDGTAFRINGIQLALYSPIFKTLLQSKTDESIKKVISIDQDSIISRNALESITLLPQYPYKEIYQNTLEIFKFAHIYEINLLIFFCVKCQITKIFDKTFNDIIDEPKDFIALLKF